MSDEDAVDVRHRWQLLNETFTPHQPVQTRDIFSGRNEQLFQCLAIVDQIGNHGILYGDRGVGKTSMANIVQIMLDSPNERAFKIDCTSSDSFKDVVKNIYDKIVIEKAKPAEPGFHQPEDHFESVTLSSLLKRTSSFNPKHVAQVLGQIPGRLFVILDEFDRLDHDRFSLASFTELLKIIADNGLEVQFLVVGVGENVEQIIGDHGSIGRSLTQIHLSPMSDEEIRGIITTGLSRIGMSMPDKIMSQIIDFSCGYPHYTHLLCLHACSNALHRDEDVVDPADLEYAKSRAISRAHESLKKSYQKATGSNRENIYKEVLQACGQVTLDQFNTFQPRDVTKPLSQMLKREMKATHFGSHLQKLCQPERGCVLVQEGERGRRRYRFRDPLMRAYVKLHTQTRR